MIQNEKQKLQINHKIKYNYYDSKIIYVFV